jgi:hypothetical protein
MNQDMLGPEGLIPGPTTFGNPSGQGASLLMGDASVRWLSSDTDPKVLNAIGTRNGREPPVL